MHRSHIQPALAHRRPARQRLARRSGHRESDGPPLQLDSIFRIASMTKAVTTVAALQLVEQGKVSLDEPVARHLPQFKNVQLLAGFDAQGEPILGPAVTPPTLRHLLTHTSGLCYDMWDPDMFRYTSKHPTADNVPGPLIFEPGTRWQYGQGLDWTGRLVETVSGLTLEDYFQQNICTPLGMADTSFIFPADKFERLVTNYHRNESGDLQQDERKLPTAPKTFGGGGGLYSTAADYIRFMQMILNQGLGPNGARVLRADTVAEMEVNQIGVLTPGKMKTQRPDLTSDVDMQPGRTEKWSLGFLLNTTAYPGGRSAGSLAWPPQHLLLDRPETRPLRRHSHAVPPLCRPASPKPPGRIRASRLRHKTILSLFGPRLAASTAPWVAHCEPFRHSADMWKGAGELAGSSSAAS